MDEKFKTLIVVLPHSLKVMLEMPPLTFAKRSMPASGVYLFSEGENKLYVGRSNSLHGRYGRHCLPGTTHNQASFAFKLAREMTGRMVASYRTGDDSRKGLMEDKDFVSAFHAAKERIRAMEYRFVEEKKQTRQALLEIYAATVLATPYNDFGTY